MSISGEGFFARVRTQLGGDAPELSESFAVTVCGVRIADVDVTRVDSNTLSVVVPPGLPMGSCEVTVRVPDGQRATLPDGLTVTTDTAGLALTIENAPGGAGQPVVDCEVACGGEATFYAVFRDAYGVVVDAPPATWVLEGDIGQLVAERGVMTTLVASRLGNATLRAIADSGQTASTGVLRVAPGSPVSLRIESASRGAGAPVDDLTLQVGDAVTLYAVGYDRLGNVTGDLPVTWRSVSDIGTLSTQAGSSYASFTALVGGTTRVIAEFDVGLVDSTGDVIVDDSGTTSKTVVTNEAVCGNAIAEAGEACDGADLRGETCASRGYLAGGGTLSCDAACAGFDPSGCTGGAIDSVASLRAAIAAAHATPGHEVLAIQAGTYALDSPLILDECGVSCAGKTVFGVTLRPLGGVVTLTEASGFSGTAIRVLTGQNVIEDLTFNETEIAIELVAGTDGGGNIVRANAVTSLIQTIDTAIVVASDGNLVEANAVSYSKPITASRGITVSGDDNTVVMNAIYGRFAIALALSGVGASGGMTTVDHNTVWGTGPSSTTVVSMSHVSGLCFRNNILESSGGGLGLSLDDVMFSATCGGSPAQNNVNHGNGTSCTGDQCALYCTSGGMCDRAVDPALAWPSLCVPKANPLVDSGLKLGYDMWDGDAAFYNGTAPEVGARELGVARAYGGSLSSCP